MTVLNKVRRPEAAPALFKLLSDCSVARAALDCCGLPVAVLEAAQSKPVVRYANRAFETFFGYGTGETLGKDVAMLLFRGDETLLWRLVAEQRRWELTAWRKDGEARTVDVKVACVRSVDGMLTHWVLAFSDLSEVESLRAELVSLKAVSESRLRLNPSASRTVQNEPAPEEGLPEVLFAQR